MNTNWIKLELIGDDEMLLPDPIELYSTCEALIKKEFKIFCYCSDDPILCKRLEDLGCEVVMPLISPIGSGLGIRNEHNLEIIRSMCRGLIFVDAGIGRPSDACRIMELGFDGVLLNSAIARSHDPINMAEAMRLAVKSGRKSFLRCNQKTKRAVASTTFKGRFQIFNSTEIKNFQFYFYLLKIFCLNWNIHEVHLAMLLNKVLIFFRLNSKNLNLYHS